MDGVIPTQQILVNPSQFVLQVKSKFGRFYKIEKRLGGGNIRS